MNNISQKFAEKYEAESHFIKRKIDYYQTIYKACGFYIAITAIIFINWFHIPLFAVSTLTLVLISGLFLRKGYIVASEISLFMAGVHILAVSVGHLSHFQFYGNLVVMLFGAVIVYIKPWQLYVIYTTTALCIGYRNYLAHLYKNTLLLGEQIVQDNLYITVSIIMLVVLSLYLNYMIRQGIYEKIQLIQSRDIDLLTKLYTRQKLHMDIRALEQQSFEMAIIDIDHFKKVNDTYGHESGDRILEALTKEMTRQFLEPAFKCYRWGGEEFVIIATDTTSEIFDMLLNVFREDIDNTFLSGKIHVTISIGTLHVSKSSAFDSAFNACDKALYSAKDNGRNRLVRGGTL